MTRFLESKSSAWVIEERNCNPETLKEVLINLCKQPEKVTECASRLHQLELGAPAKDISSYLLKTVLSE